MNWLDLLLGAVLLWSVASSFSKGFVREAIGLAASIAGLLTGAWFYRMAGAPLEPYLGSEPLANLCGFLLIFVGVLLVGRLVSLVVGMLVKAVGLSFLNRLAGAAFGAARGIVVCVALITAIIAFSPGSDVRDGPQVVASSRIAPYMVDAAHALTLAAPRELRDQFAQGYEQVKRLWEEAARHGVRRLPESEI